MSLPLLINSFIDLRNFLDIVSHTTDFLVGDGPLSVCTTPGVGRLEFSLITRGWATENQHLKNNFSKQPPSLPVLYARYLRPFIEHFLFFLSKNAYQSKTSCTYVT